MDVRLSRGRKRSERRLLLLQEELVVAKLQRGTSVRPQLRLALDQLWVLSHGEEAAGEEEEEEGSREDRTSIILAWPTGSCVATFGSCWLSCGTKDQRRRGYSAKLPAGQRFRSCARPWTAARTSTWGRSQPALLLAVLLKVSASDLLMEELLAGLGRSKAHLQPLALQDFLRSIPAKLLASHLYEDWMDAMERTSRQAKVEELKAVAEKLPAANLLLLKRLLSLLQHIGHNASASRMTSRNLATCLGPSLLSPPNEDLLPLEAALEVTAKVNVLVEFLIENCADICAQEMPGLSCPPAEESPAPLDTSTGLPLEEESGPAGSADTEHQAKAFVDTPPSLPVLHKEAQVDMVVGLEMEEVPVPLPPITPESTIDAQGKVSEQLCGAWLPTGVKPPMSDPREDSNSLKELNADCDAIA
ncbi:T-cell activation Rho GTPase-activating protein-like [Grus japonensis]|uniref:T-cell activation Rho GTPase-activating protein-like n=1 Tax=Grus japonensis TaxID=30415 RepID=A0ABC9WSU2_GRUJA